MKIPSLILDSYALITYFEREKGFQKVVEWLKRGENRQAVLMISAINWGEVFYIMFRSKGSKVAQEVMVLIEQLPIEVIDVNRELIYEAAQLKAQYPLSYADCFAAALARQKQCPVLTGDQEFKRLGEEIKIDWL